MGNTVALNRTVEICRTVGQQLRVRSVCRSRVQFDRCVVGPERVIGPKQSRWAGQFKGLQWADGRVRQDSRVGQSRWAGQSPLNRPGHREQDVVLGISVAFFRTVGLGRSSRTVGFGQSVAMGQRVMTVRRSRWADPGPGRTLALGRTVTLGQWDGQSPSSW